MTTLYHLNCVKIVSPVKDNVCGHCLLLEEDGKLMLIDTGIGLEDVRNPGERIGQQLSDSVGYRFDETLTAVRQIEKLGFAPALVTDCIISHLDNDHTGGLADFPGATVHVGAEELENYNSGNSRYLQAPLAHRPLIKSYPPATSEWFGFEARKVDAGLRTEIYLIPLFGHTYGHCGVALKNNDRWLFYTGDAYYLRLELTDPLHPVNELARMRADDDNFRKATLERIRRFTNAHPEIEIFGYHDIDEFIRYAG